MFMLSLIKTMIGGFIVKKSTLYSIIMLLLVLVFTQLDAIAFAEDSFELVTVTEETHIEESSPSSWAEADINQAIENQIATDKILSFYQNKITREEFCELIIKLYEILKGSEAPIPTNNPFTDTNNTEILKANSLGIVQGKGNWIFDPNGLVTRQEVAVMYNRLLESLEIYPIVTMEYVYFADENEIEDWAKNSVQLLNKLEIINGVGEKRIAPLGNVTREQAIVMSNRIFMRFK